MMLCRWTGEKKIEMVWMLTVISSDRQYAKQPISDAHWNNCYKQQMSKKQQTGENFR